MESADTVSQAWQRGYREGWQSLRGSGAPPSVPGYVSPDFFLEGKSPYESGYARGRTAAAQSAP